MPEQLATLLVTHAPAEATRLADRVYLMNGQPAKLSLETGEH